MYNMRVLFSKIFVIGILILFIVAGVIPIISGEYNDEQDVSTLTFYTFGRTGTQKCEVELPSVVVEDISVLFEGVKKGITSDPFGAETESLKSDFVDILDLYNVIPRGLSKDDVFSLLNPGWSSWCDGDVPFLGGGFVPAQYSHRGSAFLCSIAGGGGGMMLPPVMLPRPRLATFWAAYNYYAVSVASNLYTGHGFGAAGPQFGMALGFWGVGLSFAVPGEPSVFGFGGYALAAWVMAEYVENYPPNSAPVISEEVPSDGVWDVSVSLSELSFRISDADGDRLSYKVSTSPDIGGGEGFNKVGGVYSVPVSGLEFDKSYSWTVSVSDGTETVEKRFGFFTEVGPPFDPFDEGWNYRKEIIVNHSLVAGDLSGFPVLVSLVDSDLAVKAQFDGDDVLFMDGSGVADRLYHEIEFFDGSCGELVAWVNVPSVSSSTDSVFYLYYGNSGCDDQQFAERVWDKDYCGVWHLDDFRDSSLNGNDGTNHGTDDCLGKIGNARGFVRGEKDYVDWDDMPEPADNNINKATFQAWYNPDDMEKSSPIFLKYNTGKDPDIMSYSFRIRADGNIAFRAGSGSWSPSKNVIDVISDDSVVTTNNWNHIVAVIDLATRDMELYHNGILIDYTINIQGSAPSYFHNVASSEESGRQIWESTNTYLDGQIDEIRISKVLRSPEWIITEYNNQNDPFEFYNIGPEESAP